MGQPERLAVFNINEVSFTFGGLSLGDLPAEDWLTIEAAGPSYETEAGANGGVVRYALNERRLTIKMKCKGSSSDNQKLSAILALDEASGTGAGVSAGMIKDANGASLYAGQCWITGIPSNALGKKRGDVEWTFEMVRKVGAATVGGN